ncbi:MAG: uracil-DNA glycosylase [Balneolaceae bacterium]|nr:uracil-DNA glycosylase [Balneolaceae bacterium]
MNSSKDLYSEIAQFLENEREVYGPFSMAETEINADTEPSVSAAKPTGETIKTVVEEENKEYRSMTTREKIEACSTLDELHELCEKAEELRTDLKGTNLVFGVGNPQADLMLIGEAPGAEEDRQGEPFVGAAGQLLNKILAAVNFNREDVYIANILKHRPPGNRNPNPDERSRSLPYLFRQIDLIQPKIILCLGLISGNTLLNREDLLRDLRGGFHPFRGADLTVTYHPAALLRNPQWKRPTWEDVQKVRKRYDELGCKP